MTTIYLIRHGESVTNAQKRFTGQIDVDLSPRGHEQARLASDFLVTCGIDRVYSSDLKRAYHTALPTAQRLGLPVETSKDLREAFMGVWEGMPIEEVLRCYPKEHEAWKLRDGRAGLTGETFAEISLRANRVLRQIAEENDGKNVLIASHGGVIRAVVCEVRGLPLARLFDIDIQHNAGVCILTYENGRFSILENDRHDYLKESETPADGRIL